MKASSLAQLKKEIQQIERARLSEIVLKLAKYKKENKELLDYLVHDAADPMAYARIVKSDLQEEFDQLNSHYYYSSKSLRKIMRQLSRYSRYTGSKEVEIDLLLWFCDNYLEHADLRTNHKPLRTIYTRQLEKINKLIPKLHEDLQYDYTREFERVIAESESRIRWFSKRDLKM